MSQNRRRHPRVEVGLPATLYVLDHASELSAELVNLSEGGAFVTAEGTVERDFRVELRFASADGEHAVNGRVVRQRANGAGIEFEDADAGLREFIRELLSLADDVHTRALTDEEDGRGREQTRRPGP